MRVTHLVTSLALGGGEKNLLRLIKNTDNINHTVCFIGIDRTLKQEFVDAGAEVVDFGYEGLADLPSFVKDLYQFFRKRDPEILHLHLVHAIIFGRIVGSAAGVENIIGTHQNVSRSYPPLWRFLERLTRPLEDYSIAVSKAVRHSFVDGNPDNWEVIYNGIDVNAYNEDVSAADPVAGDELTVLNIGRYHEQKNQLFLIDALNEFAKEYNEFVAYIVGWGELEDQLRARARKHEIENHVEITGKVKDVERYYRSADVFVLSSHFEGLPLTATEAMSAGLPIIGTDVPGVREVVDDGETGYLVSNDDAGELADALSKLRSVKQREDFGSRAFEKAKKTFDIARTSQRYRDVYATVRS